MLLYEDFYIFTKFDTWNRLRSKTISNWTSISQLYHLQRRKLGFKKYFDNSSIELLHMWCSTERFPIFPVILLIGGLSCTLYSNFNPFIFQAQKEHFASRIPQSIIFNFIVVEVVNFCLSAIGRGRLSFGALDLFEVGIYIGILLNLSFTFRTYLETFRLETSPWLFLQ